MTTAELWLRPPTQDEFGAGRALADTGEEPGELRPTDGIA
jgi:hypothetical protein